MGGFSVARVVNTDNHGSDYPDEKFMSESISRKDAERLAAELNEDVNDWSERWNKVVEDDYQLAPGFEP